MSDLTPVIVPQMNPNDDTAVLVGWHADAGSRVDEGQLLVTLETSKSAFDVHAPCAGHVFFDREPHSIVDVGSIIAWIGEQQHRPERLPEIGRVGKVTQQEPSAKVSRKALRLMNQNGLSLSDFADLDRVMTEDVERALRERSNGANDCGTDDEELLDQSPAKIIEVQTLTEVYRQAVPSTVAMAVSVAKTNERLKRLGATVRTVSMLEMVIHCVARLLVEFPELNGFYARNRAWRFRSVSIGFAINIGGSLRVPVVHQADHLSQREIVATVRELSLKYMRDELEIGDLTGGTFTVTDLSVYDVNYFVPVLNQRQSAILGICAERPGSGYRDLVLSFDHRMTDGMQAAKFLGRLRDLLEEAPAG